MIACGLRRLWTFSKCTSLPITGPDFNVADSAIVVGGILLMLDAFRSTKSASD